jgi:hypothetical protein
VNVPAKEVESRGGNNGSTRHWSRLRTLAKAVWNDCEWSGHVDTIVVNGRERGVALLRSASNSSRGFSII